MATRTKKIDELADLLESTGGDAVRLDALRRTQKFKRSWVDLAEILVKIRRKRSYEGWGYADFYSYCSQELQIRRATVDKLTISFSTIQQHAPQVLTRDGVAKTIPSYQAVDYFQRAVGPSANDEGDGHKPAREPPREKLDELSQAVFDEGQPVAELRRRFDSVFHPKPRGQQKLELMQRASASARKLAELLPDIDGLTQKRVRELEKTLGTLREELDELMEPLREKLAKRKRKLKPPRPDAAATP